MKRRHAGAGTEAVVGFFVAFAILFLGIMIWSVGSFHILQKGYHITVGFNHVNGLAPNAPVYVSGRKVGEVQEIVLHPPTPRPANALGEAVPTYSVTVRAWIPADVPLYEDCIARISSQGVLGEMYLDIEPGMGGRKIEARDFLRGRDPIPLAQIIETSNKTVEGVHEIVANLRRFAELLGDETGIARELRLAVSDARMTIQEVHGVVAENREALRSQMRGVNEMVEENRANLRATTANLRDFSADVRRISAGFEERLDRISGKLEGTLAAGSDTLAATLDEAYLAARTAREGVEGVRANLENASDSVSMLVAANGEEIREATENLAAASVSFRAAADEARGLMDEARNGHGTLATLVSDTETALRLRRTIENAEAASEATRGLVEDIRKDPHRYLRFSVF